MVGEVERLGQGDQLALFDLQRPFERFELLALVEDALDQRRRLTIGVGQDRLRLCRFGRRRLRGDSRKVDPLDSGGGNCRRGHYFGLCFHTAMSLDRAVRNVPSLERV